MYISCPFVDVDEEFLSKVKPFFHKMIVDLPVQSASKTGGELYGGFVVCNKK